MNLSRYIHLLAAAVLFLSAAACGGTDAAPAPQAEAAATEPAAEPAPPAVSTVGPNSAIVTADGNQLAFATKSFTAKAGTSFTLVFENTATSAAMAHNVVIVRSEADVQRVGQASMAAGAANDYVAEDDAVIAATPLAAPGETVQVTFTVPDTPGEYPFICTYAGHYMMMKGMMTVTN